MTQNIWSFDRINKEDKFAGEKMAMALDTDMH